MSWWNRFGTSLLFALGVAGGYPLYAGIAELVMGRRLAFAFYLLASAGIYLLGIARRPIPGLGAAFATFTTGMAMLAAGFSGTDLALITGALIGVFRSGLLHRNPTLVGDGFARRFVSEVLLIGAGLGLAFHLAQGSRHPEALAFWGFFLVQSGYFLIGGRAAGGRSRSQSPVAPDPFDRAIKRAREVLGESPTSLPRS